MTPISRVCRANDITIWLEEILESGGRITAETLVTDTLRGKPLKVQNLLHIQRIKVFIE